MISLLTCIIFLCLQTSFAQNCITNPENRTEIKEDRPENNFIAHMVIRRNRKRIFNATASFISPNVIICAGHSIKEKWHSKITEVELIIGQRNEEGENVYISKYVFNRKDIKTWVNPVFQKAKNPDFDFAVVALNKNVVSQFFNLGEFQKLKVETDTLYMNGYPGDKGNKELWMKQTLNENVIVKNKVLLYDMFTYKADSGAPVWCKAEDKYHLVAVHGTGHYRNGSCNAGVKITKERIDFLKDFIRKNEVN